MLPVSPELVVIIVKIQFNSDVVKFLIVLIGEVEIEPTLLFL